MVQFFRRIILSTVSPASYAELLGKSFWRGFWYLYFLLTIISIITVMRYLDVRPTAHKWAVTFADALKADAKTLYPEELEIAIDRGEVRTNVTEPYYVDLPAHLKSLLDEEVSSEKPTEHKIRHLLAIDTSGHAEDYYRYESIVLLTKRSVVYPDNKTFKIQPITTNEQLLINKKVYDSFLAEVLPYAEYIPKMVDIGVPLLMVSYPLIEPSGTICVYLIYLLVTSLVLLAVSSIMGKHITYGTIYVVSLYGVTLPAVVNELFNLPTFLFSLIFLLWMLVVIVRLPSQKSS